MKVILTSTSLYQYNNPQYVRALQFLQTDERVTVLGLCNFDTKRMEEVIGAGVKVATNQVQVIQYQRISISGDWRPSTLVSLQLLTIIIIIIIKTPVLTHRRPTNIRHGRRMRET